MSTAQVLPSLRARILRLTTGTTLVTALIMCVAGAMILRESLTRVALQSLKPELELHAHQISDSFAFLKIVAERISEHDDVEEAVDLLSQRGHSLATDPTGDQKMTLALNRVSRAFEEIIRENDNVLQLKLVNASGTNSEIVRMVNRDGEVVRSGPDELRQLSEAPFLRDALTRPAGTTWFSDLTPEPSLRGGRPVLRIMHAVPDSYGNKAVYLVLMLDYELLMNEVVDYLQRDVRLDITTPDGASMRFTAFAQRPVLHRVHSKTGGAHVPEESVVQVGKSVAFDPNVGVQITLIKSRDVVMAQVNRQMRWSLFLAVGLVGVAAILAAWLGGLLTRNLSNLADAVGARRGAMEKVKLTGSGFHEAQVLAQRFETVFNQLVEKTKEANWNATNDPLSGLLNRRGIDVALSREGPEPATMTVITLDLDRFKLVNDMLGHEAGDAVIAAVGERLREICDATDMIGRMGGDEFLIIRRDAELSQLGDFADSAIAHLSQPVLFEGKECRFGVSMGLATGKLAHLRSGALYKRADQALYKAKDGGRGQYCIFSESMERRMFDRSAIANDLEFAIENESLVVEYMPKVATGSLRPLGLEALVRWDHPERGRLYPGAFLPIADELKMSHLIDEAVLRRVLVDQARWRAQDGLDLPVSVNVSARRLLDPQMVESVRELNITPGTIRFELLESIFLEDVSNTTVWNCDALKEMGLGIEIDDFGTGHASLLSVTRIRPDWLKIDEALIRNVGKTDIDNELVNAIVRMAQPFGISVIAEGVRTMEQAELLAELGCAALQGEFMSMPIPAWQVPGWTHAHLASIASKTSRTRVG